MGHVDVSRLYPAKLKQNPLFSSSALHLPPTPHHPFTVSPCLLKALVQSPTLALHDLAAVSKAPVAVQQSPADDGEQSAPWTSLQLMQ